MLAILGRNGMSSWVIHIMRELSGMLNSGTYGQILHNCMREELLEP